MRADGVVPTNINLWGYLAKQRRDRSHIHISSTTHHVDEIRQLCTDTLAGAGRSQLVPVFWMALEDKRGLLGIQLEKIDEIKQNSSPRATGRARLPGMGMLTWAD